MLAAYLPSLFIHPPLLLHSYCGPLVTWFLLATTYLSSHFFTHPFLFIIVINCLCSGSCPTDNSPLPSLFLHLLLLHHCQTTIAVYVVIPAWWLVVACLPTSSFSSSFFLFWIVSTCHLWWLLLKGWWKLTYPLFFCPLLALLFLIPFLLLFYNYGLPVWWLLSPSYFLFFLVTAIGYLWPICPPCSSPIFFLLLLFFFIVAEQPHWAMCSDSYLVGGDPLLPSSSWASFFSSSLPLQWALYLMASTGWLPPSSSLH